MAKITSYGVARSDNGQWLEGGSTSGTGAITDYDWARSPAGDPGQMFADKDEAERVAAQWVAIGVPAVVVSETDDDGRK